jgi:hypothetical protein
VVLRSRKILAIAQWQDSLSNYWKGRPVKSLNAFRVMEKQYDKHYAKLPVGKKPHDLAAAPQARVIPPAPDHCSCPHPDIDEEVPGYCFKCRRSVAPTENLTPGDDVELPKSKAFEIED